MQLAVLPTLPRGFARLAYIDPPFNTGKRQTHSSVKAVQDPEGKTGFGGRRYTLSATREKHVYEDAFDDYLGFLMPRIEAALPCLTEDASLFVHLDYRAVHYVKVALDRVFGRDRFVNEVVWCYAVGGKSRRGFGRKHDTILWYARGPSWAFYPDAVRVPRRGGSHMRLVDGVQEKTDRKTGRVYRYPVAAGKIPEDWWTDIETLNHSDRERTGWPSQKPERLLARLLSAVTVPGDRVADWFAGSGTTAVTAQRLGRRFVAVDRSPEAVAVAAARLTRQGHALAAGGTAPPDLVVRGLASRGVPSSTARTISAPALAARRPPGENSPAQGD